MSKTKRKLFIEDPAAWIAEAISAPFHTPRRLPLVRRSDASVASMVSSQPSLWSQLGEELPGRPETIGVATKPGPKVASVERPAGRTTADCVAALIAAGLVPNEACHSINNGVIQDPSVPYTPRSISFPIQLSEEDGVPVLILSTPATRGAFVKHVEGVTGLRAKWRPGYDGTSLGQWYHAVDLATDEGWERLVRTMWFTTPGMVVQAVGMHIASGSISVRNGRLLLLGIGVEEPIDRSDPELLAMRPGSGGGPCTSLSGWAAVHAFEDGWLSITRNKGAQFTEMAKLRLAGADASRAA